MPLDMYLPGSSLHRFDPRVEQGVACRYIIFTQLLSALVELNNKNLVHADIKHENILRYVPPAWGLASSHNYFSVKLADLASAMPLGSAEQCVYGTLHFRAPEHRPSLWQDGKRVDGLSVDVGANTDTWAAGLVLAECLLGDSLEDTYDTLGELERMHQGEMFPDIVIEQLKRISGLEVKWLEMVELCLLKHTIRPKPETLLKWVTSHPLFASERAQMRALDSNEEVRYLLLGSLPLPLHQTSR
jgi:serine/threonine protein kinase